MSITYHYDNTKTHYLLGYSCGIGARNPGCCMGPLVLEASDYLAELRSSWEWIDHLMPTDNAEELAAIPMIADLCQRVARYIEVWVKEHRRFAVIGGDHSSAIGTWNGAAAGLDGPLGLIWVDAHMDANTPESSPSGCVHGMPLACLLGHGDDHLVNLFDSPSPILLPQNLVLIGVRHYEDAEVSLLEQLGVTFYCMETVKSKGLPWVMKEAIQQVRQGTAGYGFSIDIDGLDPKEAPGTGYREPDGIDPWALCDSLSEWLSSDCEGREPYAKLIEIDGAFISLLVETKFRCVVNS